MAAADGRYRGEDDDGDVNSANPPSGDPLGAMVNRDVNISCGSSMLPALFIEHDLSSMERSIFDISTKEFHVMKNPNFQGATCICGKGRWLLMRLRVQRSDCCFKLFLLNPVSGVRIDLPTVQGFLCGNCTFSLNGGSPDLVISVNTNYRRKTFIFRIIHAGGEAWEEHSIGGIGDTKVGHLALAGSRVLCVDRKGNLIIFDLLERNLRFLSKLKLGLNGLSSVIECDGEVVKVDCGRPAYRYFRLTRFDWGLMDWVELCDRELENASWFVGTSSACMRKSEGKKVYTLRPNEYGGPNQPDFEAAKRHTVCILKRGTGREYNVYMHDSVLCHDSIFCPWDRRWRAVSLEKKTTESLLPDVCHAETARWVDAEILC